MGRRKWVFTAVILLAWVGFLGRGSHRLARGQESEGDPTPGQESIRLTVKLDGSSNFVFVNHLDYNNNEKPDYADLAVGHSPIMAPLTLQITLPPEIHDYSGIKIRLAYTGQSNLPTLEGRDVGMGFKDYSGIRNNAAHDNVLRLWNITATALQRRTSDYLIPNHDYTAAELGFTGSKTFYIEGINPASASAITATVTLAGQIRSSTVTVSVVEPDLWVNNSNNDSDNLNPGTPDVGFVDDPTDEMLEHQKDGFAFWWCELPETSNLGDTDNPYKEFVNLAPMKLTIPAALRNQNWKAFLAVEKLGGTGTLNAIYVYPAINGAGDDRLRFMKGDMTPQTDNSDAQIALVNKAIQLVPGTTSPLREVTEISADTKELLFKAAGSGTVKCKVTLWIQPPTTQNPIPVDSVVLTLRDVKEYWSLWSTREGSPSEHMSIPIDDETPADLTVYPAATQKHKAVYADQKKRVLVHVHGYLAPPDLVESGTNDYFRRLFWTGYRGHVIAFMWEGDEMAPLFDPNIFNAFQTAPRLQQFLADNASRMTDGNVTKLDLSAHSLGNLVMFESLRLQERWHPGAPLVNNAISIEAAVPQEAFEPCGNVVYRTTNTEYIAVRPGEEDGDEITYVPAALTQMSWRFWFRQHYQVSLGVFRDGDVVSAVGGQLYHTHNEFDHALSYWMRFNDYSRDLSLWCVGHYDRTISGPRSLINGVFNQKHSMENIPLLMNRRHPPAFSYTDLRLPLGAVTIAGGRIQSQDLTQGGAFNADIAWPNGEGENATSSDHDASHGGFRSIAFPRIYAWYDQFLRDPNHPALLMGVEK
jgi:hypothetical protein